MPLPPPKTAERIAKVMARVGPCLAPRGRGLDRGGPGVGQRRQNHVAGAERHRDGQDHGGRQAAAAEGAHAAVSVSQAARPRHHLRRHPRPPDHLRRAAEGHAAGGEHRPARSQHRRPAAADQRRRACARAGTAGDRLAAALSRARARQDHAGAARRLAPRHRGRRHPLRRDRGDARSRAGLQRLAHLCDARGQEPRDPQRARAPGAGGEPPDPRVLWAVPAGRPAGRRGGGGQDPRAARADRRADRRRRRRGFFRAAGGAGGARLQERRPGQPEVRAPEPDVRRSREQAPRASEARRPARCAGPQSGQIGPPVAEVRIAPWPE